MTHRRNARASRLPGREDQGVEAALVDDVHLLDAARGVHIEDTLFIVVEADDHLPRVPVFKHCADVGSDEPRFAVVYDGPHSMTLEAELGQGGRQ